MKLKHKLLYALSGALAALLLSSALPVLAAQIEAAFNIVNIVVDGKSVAKTGESYKLADGSEVPYSIAYKGTTYLPLKKLGEILGFDASWDEKTSTANVSSEDRPGAIPVSPPQPSVVPSPDTTENVTPNGINISLVKISDKYYSLRRMNIDDYSISMLYSQTADGQYLLFGQSFSPEWAFILHLSLSGKYVINENDNPYVDGMIDFDQFLSDLMKFGQEEKVYTSPSESYTPQWIEYNGTKIIYNQNNNQSGLQTVDGIRYYDDRICVNDILKTWNINKAINVGTYQGSYYVEVS
ncbi:MAG: copper amine oxidase N-terminal domain-containing protein [Oscillospiraceae bacterium]|jgi:hypothetical protein|nr:copper amine oxidase N-terminal domain-containing protein [Oscillospiraceae bacterium]